MAIEQLKADHLKALCNEIVSVFCGPVIRHGFDTAICVNGKLEQHTTEFDRFRVVISKGTYAYFKVEDVDSITVHPEKFKDDAKAVIRIEI